MTSTVIESIEEINRSLKKNGYYFSSNKISYEEFCKLIEPLGETINIDNIKLKKESTQYYTNPEAMVFHNDICHPGYIAWHRFDKLIYDEPTQLINCRDINTQLSTNTLNELKDIYITLRNEESTPIYRNDEDKIKLYFIPWVISKKTDCTPQQINALKELLDYIQYKIDNESISVSLDKDQFLIIDDSFMLHGRGPLQNNSKRHLVRHWIKKVPIK